MNKNRIKSAVNSAISQSGLSICIALGTVLIYQIQRIVFAYLGPDLFQWLFTYQSISTVTPGLVLSIFSHGSVPHLLFNSAIFLVFAGLSEIHLRRIDYAVFLLLVGFSASVVQVQIDPSSAPTLGISGAAYGFVFYWMFHTSRNHLRRSELASHTETVRLSKILFSTLGFILVGVVLLSEALGLTPSGKSAEYGHLFGAVSGILLEYCQSGLQRYKCRE